MRKYQLLKEAVLKIISHKWVKDNLILYEEIKKSLKRLAQIEGDLIKSTKGGAAYECACGFRYQT